MHSSPLESFYRLTSFAISDSKRSPTNGLLLIMSSTDRTVRADRNHLHVGCEKQSRPFTHIVLLVAPMSPRPMVFLAKGFGQVSLTAGSQCASHAAPHYLQNHVRAPRGPVLTRSLEIFE
jgi:hypothetical protein